MNVQFLRKKLVLLLVLFAIGGYSQECRLGSASMVEAKGGYFFFANSKMREVYDNGGWDIQLSSSIPFWRSSKRFNLNAYASVEFLRCSGHSTQENYKTYVWELPVNIGIKPTVLLSKWVQYYFALGPRYFFIRQHNSSPYVDKHRSRNGVGLFLNTGFNFILFKRLVIDVFGEYSYAKTHFHSSALNVYTRNIEVGGFTFGAGLGYCF